MGDYPNLREKSGRAVLPPPLRERLSVFCFPERLEQRDAFRTLLEDINHDLNQLPAGDMRQASDEIRGSACLWSYRHKQLSLLETWPNLKHLFLFHANGYVREAALKLVDGAAPGPFIVCAVAYQVNHWVPEVRRAAVEAFRRLLPATDVRVLTESALYLMAARRHWQRGADDLAVIDSMLTRPDVCHQVIEHLITMKAGAPHRILLAAAADPQIDQYLGRLLRESAHPALRTVSAQALMRRELRWVTGLEKRWIDKAMGKFTWASRFACRPLNVDASASSLVVEFAADRLPQIRKIAMQAIIDAPALWCEREPLIQRLSADRSAVIRAGMDFIRRQQAKESLDPAAS